jgi:hypothetical protein
VRGIFQIGIGVAKGACADNSHAGAGLDSVRELRRNAGSFGQGSLTTMRKL